MGGGTGPGGDDAVERFLDPTHRVNDEESLKAFVDEQYENSDPIDHYLSENFESGPSLTKQEKATLDKIADKSTDISKPLIPRMPGH